MAKHKIFISPGHNEFTFDNTGAKGVNASDGRFEEFDFNVDVAEALVKKLKEYKNYFDVIQLEYDNNKVDKTLSQRIAYINQIGKKTDLILSLHANAGKTSMKGQWGFYVSSGGLKFINIYKNKLKDALIKYTNTYKCVKNTWTSYGIVLKTIPVAVLIEFGFFTNSTDRKILRSKIFIDYCAEKVFQSVLEYYGIKKIIKPEDKNWLQLIEKTKYPEEWKAKLSKSVEIAQKYNLGDLDWLEHLPDLLETIGNK